MHSLAVERRYPLAPLQEGMLFQALRSPGSGINVEQVVCRLDEAMDAERLEAAWSEVVARTDVLRTRFRWEDESERVQEVVTGVRPTMARDDWTSLAAAEQEARLQQWLAEDRARGFDLAQAPAMRLALFRMAADAHVLVWTFHHILLDGRSVGHVLQDVLTLYDAPESEFPVRRAFHEHVAWLHQRYGAVDEAYWTAHLRGVSAPEPVRAIRGAPRDPAMEPASGDRELLLSAAETDALRAFEAEHGVWLNTLVQGAWALLMGRYTGASEVVLGVVRGGRGEVKGADGMVGLLINTVPVRIPLPSEARVADWLEAIGERTAALIPHEHAALPDIKRWSGIPAETELFGSVLNFQPRPFDAQLRALGGPWARRSFRALRHPGLPLALDVAGGERLRARMHYDADRFDEAAIDRMLGHFANLLRAMVQAPDAPLSSLRLTSAEERAALVDAGRARRVHPATERIEQRFATRVAERPDAPAVTFGATTLTYGELDARADRLAARLRARGVGPETRVGIALERSAELVIALLATLRAGGAYVPLDPAYPADRIAFVLEDCGAPVLVTSTTLLPRLPAFAGDVICVDDEPTDADANPVPAATAGPDALAYVIYTSGSTGRPKGVEVTHANVLRLFDATDASFGFGADDVWTLFHSAAFDFSVWEIWGALLHGGRLVVVPFSITRSPEDFHRLLVDDGVTVLNQTPSAFRQLIEADRVSGVAADALHLRYVIFGGEALDPRMLRPWMDRHGDRRPRLVNMYGITETTVHVTFRPLTRADAEHGGSPLGVPIADLALHLLDPAFEPVPPSVAGELFVGGAGVARGYLGRPALTAERFVPDPFGLEPGARLYRSGDQAVHRGDGELDYLGRGDRQVKVRGFRIETGEIEAALAAHPEVAAAVVDAREDDAEERRLVAWVVGRNGAPEPAALRAHLAASLPEHMVPAAFVPMDALPLTENGKLDRRALPAPEAAGVVAAASYAAPRTAVETALTEAWGEVLGIRVGIDDDYFALGGDSIRSVRLVAAARRRGLTLSIPALYRWRTVRALAENEALDGTIAEDDSHPHIPFALLAPDARHGLPDDVEDAYPASRVQLAMLYHTQRDPASVLYQNLNAWRVHTRFDGAALREALRQLAARHPVLRTSFDLAATPEPVQCVHRRAEIPLEVADLRHLDAAGLDAWMERETSRGFDWTRPPLLRFHAHVLGDDAFRLVLAEHHAVLDGWSVASLVTELLRAYVAIRDGGMNPAGPPPAARFRDFVALEREAVASAESQAFWRDVVDGAPLAELPPRDGGSDDGDASRSGVAPVTWIELPDETASGVRRMAEQAGVPMKTVLLAAHLRVLALLAGTDDVVSGYITSGRPEAEDGERVLGMFLNTVPLRVRMQGGSWLDLVRRTWAAEQAFVAHRRLPLAEIVRAAGGRTLFEAAFNFNHFHVYEALAETGVRLEVDRFFQKTEVPLIAIAAVHPVTGALRLRLEHDPVRLGGGQVRAIGARYARALAALASDPHARWDADALLDADEDARLRRWETGPAAESDPSTLHDLFQQQARRTPEAIAVVHDGAFLTYRALDERANQLAHALRQRGVGPEVRVGIHLTRGPGLIPAMLAVLKAGGAYVPLDPAYPAERLAFMLADAGVSVLLTESAIRDGLPAAPGAEVVVIDRDPVDEQSTDDLDERAGPGNAAYVIYTSGSTGRPKGVVIEHRSAAVLLHGLRAQVPDAEMGAVLGATSICFDVSIAEIFGTLCRGGTLHLVENALSLAALPPDAGILRATMVPSAAAELLRTRGIPPTLRSLGLGGEAVPVSLARELHALGTLERVENLYGPTEDTTYSTCWIIPPEMVAMRVGRPVAGTRAYVLDGHLARVPAGARGELYLAGDGLARGYLDRPALTAERFIPCPFGPPGSRMYRVGDQVRWAVDGTLEYLDRLDHQVKIRGHRVELGEVEEALRAHPAVADAAVVARADGDGAVLAAFVTAADDAPGLPAALRVHLAARLPSYMVPGSIVVLDALPRTPNGKVDRRALPSPQRESRPAIEAAPRTAMERRVASLWAEVLGADGVGMDENFFDAGGDSLRLFRLHALLRERLGAEMEMVDLFRLPTVRDMAAHLDGEPADTSIDAPPIAQHPAARDGAIAIVGMAGRFPGAADPAALWRTVRDGADGITRFTDEALRAAGVREALLARPEYVRARGVLNGIETFDAAFFGMSPRDAEILDPQHRVFLECAWEAMEDAGREPGEGRVGVFAGAAMSTYLDRLRAHPTLADEVGEFALRLANDKDFLSTRTAYELGLRGPAVTVQTACSTSLVAVHLACRSLRDGECDLALAGGVSAAALQTAGYLYQKGGIASPDGCCRAFDADAQGTVPGSGCGVVALKRLEDALADGDTIHAVILGSAINNDGDRKVGFTAPGVEGQAAVIRAAHAAAGVHPSSIGYVEAHGTGTALGDPVEVAALADAFGPLPAGSCALGSLKPSVGHLDTAAGVAGLIKAVLALKHGEIPPTPHFCRPNPQIGFDRTPFYVTADSRPWTRNGIPRRAGVSSFGIGGTNAHVVLEEAPALDVYNPYKTWQVLVLSAHSPTALDAVTERLADHLAAHPNLPLADVAFTLREGRRAFPHRRAVVVRDGEDAAAVLRGCAPDRIATNRADDAEPSAVLLFPGVGEQYPGMGRGLYETEPVFRDAVDHCAGILQPLLGFDLRETLFAADDEASGATDGLDLRRMLGRAPVSDAAARLSRTEVAQPVAFVVGYALARLWESWRIRPAAVIGHSLGEYTAACVAGVFSLEDALALVAARARAIQALPGGAMLAVPLAPEALAPYLADDVALAAVNAPELCVLAGSDDAIARVERRLSDDGHAARRLAATHAFHSPLMRPVADEVRTLAARMTLSAPRIPVISNVTGTWLTVAQATDPGYWAEHLLGTVHFARGAATLLTDETRVWIEAGPGGSLGTFVRQQARADGRDAPLAVSSLPHAAEGIAEQALLLGALGRLWTAGVRPDWDAFRGDEIRRRVPLPTYPFERIRHWVDLPAADGLPSTPPPTGSTAPIIPPPAPEEDARSRLRLDTPYAAPRDEVEHAVAATWERLLGVRPVGIHDDFFRLGGHSLLGIRLMADVCRELGVDLSPQALFRAPTVAGMAASVVEARLAATDQETLEAMLADVRRLSPEALRDLLEREPHNKGTAGV